MYNVLHNTPAKKLHQTLTMIYPSITYPWSRASAKKLGVSNSKLGVFDAKFEVSNETLEEALG